MSRVAVTNEEPLLIAQIESASHGFLEHAGRIERDARRRGHGIPPREQREEFADALSQVLSYVENLVAGAPAARHRGAQRALLNGIGSIVFRSEPMARAFFKPQGYAGDYRLMEMIYDVENRPGEDPYKGPLANCLEHWFSKVHSTSAVWERRHRLANIIVREARARRGDEPLRVLDVASGGARYLGDAMAQLPAGSVRAHLVDQDPAALAYAKNENLTRWTDYVSLESVPIKALLGTPPQGTYDLVISCGLFDYLEAPVARDLLRSLGSALRVGGLLAITNFHPDDRSAWTKNWMTDWPLILRTEDDVRHLFSGLAHPEISRSENRSLVFAEARITSCELSSRR